MKKSKLFMGVLILLALTLIGCRKYDDPEEFLYGSWNIVSIDSCSQTVIPNPPPVTVDNILKNSGHFKFKKDKTCTFSSCKRKNLAFGKEFNWTRVGDSIIIQYDGSYSKSLFTQYSKDKIEFNIDMTRDGMRIWYEVTLKR